MLRIILVLGLIIPAWGCSSREESATVDRGALTDPKGSLMNQQAPDQFQVEFKTSAGNFTVEVERELAPQGADRFYNLVKAEFYDEQRFFRVVPGFIVQFGMSGDPELAAVWQNATIPDDPVRTGNERGTITFAKRGIPNSRTTQLFINFKNNASLDRDGFAPFGKVVEGMDAVESIYSGYGQQPSQQQIGMQGNQYLEKRFPKLDYIEQARIVD